jgi:hypothetical protein
VIKKVLQIGVAGTLPNLHGDANLFIEPRDSSVTQFEPCHLQIMHLDEVLQSLIYLFEKIRSFRAGELTGCWYKTGPP